MSLDPSGLEPMIWFDLNNSMTAKTAAEMLENFIKIKTEYRNDRSNPYRSWNVGYEPLQVIAKEMVSETSKEIEVLEMIRQEIVPTCTHPKEDRDLDPDTRKPYCTACNWVL